jgi:hypothetical protein
VDTPGTSLKNVDYTDCRSRSRYFLKKFAKFIPQKAPSKTPVQSSFETRDILRRVAVQESETITPDRAAKVLTLLQFNPGVKITGDSIESTFDQVSTSVNQNSLSNWLSQNFQRITSGDTESIKKLELAGFQISQLPGGDGNTRRNIDPYDTDKTLNRGDFEAPDFNGQGTHM